MGVPKFFRWAGERYKAIVSGIIGTEDTVPPIDNLYVDMNGLIHIASHNNDHALKPAKKTSEVVSEICETLDWLITTIVKPERLAYFAIDGVAPRAKLNQQRARRFRAAHDKSMQVDEALQAGEEIDPSTLFDSNAITPGTAFMQEVANGIKAYILQKLESRDKHWSKLQIYFSGSEVPGEGEHKLISFIRDRRADGTMPPNTRHCIYGADADMIMLSLATHEPYVTIIREILIIDKDAPKPGHGNTGHKAIKQDKKREVEEPKEALVRDKKQLQFIRIHALREYLINDFGSDLEAGTFDGERIIDDFVFLTFLIGNDFLPHLPGLDIGDNAFDIIFEAYKTAFVSEPGYLVNSGNLDFKKLELIMQLIGAQEEIVYMEKQVQEAARQQRDSYFRKTKKDRERAQRIAKGEKVEDEDDDVEEERDAISELPPHLLERQYEEFERKERARSRSRSRSPDSKTPHTLPKSDVLDTDDLRRNYYLTKLRFELNGDAKDEEAVLKDIVTHYLTGLLWNLRYYSMGCVSWSWYYPYHYGVFLQDMKNLDEIGQQIKLELDKPLTPFEQLLACLPPASAPLLPACYRPVMLDAESPLITMYPRTFATDLNGKKNDYEAVVLLPFIDARDLLSTEAKYTKDCTLTTDEVTRNSFGPSYKYYLHGESKTVEREVIPYTIHPGTCFYPHPLAGTVDTMMGYPALSELLTMPLKGKTIYFIHSNAPNGGRGGGGRFGRKGRQPNSYSGGRGGGRGWHEGGGDAFPMPGVAPLPAIQVMPPTSRDRDHHHTLQSPNVKDSSPGGTMHSPYVKVPHAAEGTRSQLRFPLDEVADQFVDSFACMIQEKAAGFMARCNMGLDDVEQANSIVIDLDKYLYKQNLKLSLTQINAAVKAMSEKFTPITGKFIARAKALKNGIIGLAFTDNTPTEQLTRMGEFLQRQLTADHKSPKDSGFDTLSFPRVVEIGICTDGNVDHFIAWLNDQLKPYEGSLPEFTCEGIEVFGSEKGEREDTEYAFLEPHKTH